VNVPRVVPDEDYCLPVRTSVVFPSPRSALTKAPVDAFTLIQRMGFQKHRTQNQKEAPLASSASFCAILVCILRLEKHRWTRLHSSSVWGSRSTALKTKNKHPWLAPHPSALFPCVHCALGSTGGRVYTHSAYGVPEAPNTKPKISTPA